MNDQNREVMKKILYAVETGGQTYGKGDYTDFTGAGANTANEKAITIGAGGWYATEAKALLELIRKTDPAGWQAKDTAGIGKDLDTANWSKYCVAKGSTKAVCIQKLIGSPVGIACQDAYMLQQIKAKEADISKKYGTMPDGAMMECINIAHQGGYGALDRILKKTARPLTAASIYAALNTDPADKSNNNQVGDYVSRQKKVYEMIQKYCKEENGMTEYEARMKMVNKMNSWIGLKRSDRSHMVIINLYNECKPLPRGYKVQATDAYCATTVSAAAIACGYTDIIPRECGCGQMVALFQAMGRWVENDAYVPEIGDIIFYYWNDGANYATTDCTGWPDHVGVVVKVNKSTRKITVTEGNTQGAQVAQRVLEINGRYIRGYGIPDYAKKANGKSSTPAEQPKQTSGGGINKTTKWTGSANKATKVRTWAGSNTQIKSWPSLSAGNMVDVCDTIKDNSGRTWYYVRIAGKFYGFVDSNDISKTAEKKPTQSKAPAYTVGHTYTLQVELKVRVAAGTGSATKSYSQLTLDGQRHDKDRDGCLDAGTKVTVLAVQSVGSDIWIKAPSGWMAAYYQGEKYIA